MLCNGCRSRRAAGAGNRAPSAGLSPRQACLLVQVTAPCFGAGKRGHWVRRTAFAWHVDPPGSCCIPCRQKTPHSLRCFAARYVGALECTQKEIEKDAIPPCFWSANAERGVVPACRDTAGDRRFQERRVHRPCHSDTERGGPGGVLRGRSRDSRRGVAAAHRKDSSPLSFTAQPRERPGSPSPSLVRHVLASAGRGAGSGGSWPRQSAV